MQPVDNRGRVTVDQYIADLGTRAAMASEGDLAAVVMAEEVKLQDQRIGQSLQDMRLTSAVRDRISKRVSALRTEQARLRSETKGKDEERKPVQNLTREELTPLNLTINYGTGAVEQAPGGALMKGAEAKGVDDKGREQFEVSAGAIDAEIRRLESEQQSLDTDREVRMIDLNNLMTKRGNMIQWLSNVSKKRSETQAGIINNLR